MAESELLNKFLQISENRTAIFITYRLGSCVHADKILALEDGILVESGTHYELMEKGSTYAKMYESQANWYLPKKAPATRAAIEKQNIVIIMSPARFLQQL